MSCGCQAFFPSSCVKEGTAVHPHTGFLFAPPRSLEYFQVLSLRGSRHLVHFIGRKVEPREVKRLREADMRPTQADMGTQLQSGPPVVIVHQYKWATHPGCSSQTPHPTQGHIECETDLSIISAQMGPTCFPESATGIFSPTSICELLP